MHRPLPPARPGAGRRDRPGALRAPRAGVGAECEEAVRGVRLVRWSGARGRPAADDVVREEPLEIRVGAAPVAVVMRTPGHDRELVLGFLVTERVVASAVQVASVRHCTAAAGGGGGDGEATDNVVRAVLAPGVELDLESLRRHLYAGSSCGICGKTTIAAALATAPPLPPERRPRLSAARLYALPPRLREAQAVFERTGGLHAAGLFGPDGRLCVLREDVGRHNAVDKVVGWAARADRLPLDGHVLMVSGRVSFELVQKALAARIPAVAGVSAPSSLAVELAERAGLVLVGFLRGRGLNVYAGRDRVGS